MPPKRKRSVLAEDDGTDASHSQKKIARTRRSKSPQSAKKRAKKTTTRKSRRTSTSTPSPVAATVAAEDAALPTIIYHENTSDPKSLSDSYRPFIVLDFALYPNTPGKTAFYRSSGRSNDKFKGLYSNTWLPVGGLIENEYKQGEKKYERGLIIKMSTISNTSERKSYKWAHKLCCEYFKDKLTTMCGENTNTCNKYTELLNILFPDKISNTAELNNYYKLLRPYLLNCSDELFELLKDVYKEYFDITSLIINYVSNIDQLTISAYIGGGYWEKNREFCQYIKATHSSPIDINRVNRVIEDLNIPTEPALGENSAEVIEFLKRNGAQYTPEQIMAGFVSVDELDSTIYFISTIDTIITQQQRLRERFSKK